MHSITLVEPADSDFYRMSGNYLYLLSFCNTLVSVVVGLFVIKNPSTIKKHSFKKILFFQIYEIALKQ